jgi:Mn-dependent DtxR family transcriptional regulator
MERSLIRDVLAVIATIDDIDPHLTIEVEQVRKGLKNQGPNWCAAVVQLGVAMGYLVRVGKLHVALTDKGREQAKKTNQQNPGMQG